MRGRLLKPLLLAHPSRFAGVTRGRARRLLAALTLVLLGAAALATDPRMNVDAGADLMLRQAVIDGVRSGGDYYTVAADALRSGGHGLLPFAASLPTLTVIAAHTPLFALRIMAWALAIAVALAWHKRLSPALAGGTGQVAASLLLIGGMTALIGSEATIMPEIWAGLLIALSLALRGGGRVIEAIAIGLAAALLREIAGLYLLLMAALAWRDGERREAAGWLCAVGIFAAVLGFHLHAAHRTGWPIDAAPPWHMPEPGFALGALASSSALAALPLALGASLAVLAVAGWSAWRDPLAVRTAATLAGFLALIAIFAPAGDGDWALLVAPVSLIGLVFAADAVRDLVTAALRHRRITVTRVAQ